MSEPLVVARDKCIWGLLGDVKVGLDKAGLDKYETRLIDCPYAKEMSYDAVQHTQVPPLWSIQTQGVCHLCMLSRVLNLGIKMRASGSLRKDGW